MTTELNLYTEYLLLNPPRSLSKLAAQYDLLEVPLEWHQLAEREQWAVMATTVDEARSERRIGYSWQEALRTQQLVLELTSDLLDDCVRLRKGGISVSELKDVTSAVKMITAVRLQVLEGLERPESNSALEVYHIMDREGMSDRDRQVIFHLIDTF